MDKFQNVADGLQICVFCYNTTFEDVCFNCNDYKGLMPINQQTENYLGENLLEIVEG